MVPIVHWDWTAHPSHKLGGSCHASFVPLPLVLHPHIPQVSRHLKRTSPHLSFSVFFLFVATSKLKTGSPLSSYFLSFPTTLIPIEGSKKNLVFLVVDIAGHKTRKKHRVQNAVDCLFQSSIQDHFVVQWPQNTRVETLRPSYCCISQL